MSDLNWRPMTCGSEARVGPLVLRVYQRGNWVLDVIWSGRQHNGFHQDRRPDEATARGAAERVGLEWLDKEMADLRAAREQLVPLDRAVATLRERVIAELKAEAKDDDCPVCGRERWPDSDRRD